MLNILQIEDRLKDMSEDSVKRIVVDPNPSVPAFLAVNELNRRDRIKKDYQMSQQEERPTVAEQLVTGAGMPTQAVSDMAMTMSPQTNVAGNTGLEAMMPQRATPEEMPSEEEQDLMLMEDEEPLRMSYGGLINSRMVAMGQPRLMDYQENRHFPMGRRTFQSGLDNLGRDISGRVQGRTEEEVQDFVGEVGNMAQERFEVNLSEPSMAQRQQEEIRRGFGGKGMPPIMRAMNEDPRMAMLKEGGVVSMSNGGLLPEVSPRPDDTGKYSGKLGKLFGFSGVTGYDIDKAAKWDERFGKYYNKDGTIKPEFQDMVGQTTVGDASNVPYDDRIIRQEKTGTDDESFDDTVDTDTKTPPPPPRNTAGSSSFDKILGMIQEDRESAKAQRDQDRYLALMQFGLNLAKRGQLSDTGEGLKTLAMSNKAYQDQLAKLRGMDIQAMLTKETIAGKERVASATTAAALKKALAKSELDEKELANLVDDYASRIQKYDDQLGGVDGMTMSPEKKAEIIELRKRTLEKFNYYDGLLEGKRASKDVTTSVYGG
jgi:hypothetical protein|tara:strand:+ start:3055 stop:4680 length:1626 start_codon:yes stop_codon:yes gene_type:complete